MAEPTVGLPGDAGWRAREFERLLDFGEASLVPGRGFGWLDDDGRIESGAPMPLWITTRMTHVYCLGALSGRPGAADLAREGVRALQTGFADPEHDGWFRSLDADGNPLDDRKACYEHAFVLLAGSSAIAAGVPGSDEVFARAEQVVTERFWREDEQRCVESYDRAWTELEPYRGANSNMHSVEAFLAAAGVPGPASAQWRDRALAIAGRVIDEAARANGWRVPEHFDPQWHFEPEYNADHPGDPFRPYGATPGHGMEWSRLLVDLDAAVPDPPAWLVEAARELFGTAARQAWAVDGHDGFVYTLDWSDRPVVAERMHWVAAEAVLAADALARRTGESGYRAQAETWWAHIEAHFVDREHGSWRHELSSELVPSSVVWQGKPDVYHALQAVLLPDLPLAPSPAWALRARTTR